MPKEIVFHCAADVLIQPAKTSIIPFTAAKEFPAHVDGMVCARLPPWAAELPQQGRMVKVRFGTEGFILKDEASEFPLVITPFAHCMVSRDPCQIWIDGAYPTWTMKLGCKSPDVVRKLREQVGKVAFDVIKSMHAESVMALDRTSLYEPQVAPRVEVVCAGYAISSHRSDVKGWQATPRPLDLAGNEVFEGGLPPPLLQLQEFACSVVWLEFRVNKFGCNLYVLTDHTPSGKQIMQIRWRTTASFATLLAHIIRLDDDGGREDRDFPRYFAFRSDAEAAAWMAIATASTKGDDAEVQRAGAALADCARERRDKAPGKNTCYTCTELELTKLADEADPGPLTVAFLERGQQKSAAMWQALCRCHNANNHQPPPPGNAAEQASATMEHVPGNGTDAAAVEPPRWGNKKKSLRYGDVPNWVPSAGVDYAVQEEALTNELIRTGDDIRDQWTATQPEPPLRTELWEPRGHQNSP